MRSRKLFNLDPSQAGADPLWTASETTPSIDELSILGGDELLDKFVSTARKRKVKALVSIGGVSDQFCVIGLFPG